MNRVEESILNSIRKNGFPSKRVALPFQAVFSACKKNGVKLSDVLNSLKEKKVSSEIGNERIVFYAAGEEKTEGSNSNGRDRGFLKAAMDKMKGMDPNELNEIKKKVMNMSPEERADLMRKAKDFFKK